MGDVVGIRDHINDDPHVAVECRCQACGFEAMVVKPVGFKATICPSCKGETMLAKQLIFPDEYLECCCGNHLYTLGRAAAVILVSEGRIKQKIRTTRHFTEAEYVGTLSGAQLHVLTGEYARDEEA
jgi:hypothetical protein